MCRHCRPYIDINNSQGMQLDRFKNRTPARFEYIYCTLFSFLAVCFDWTLYVSHIPVAFQPEFIQYDFPIQY